MSGVGLGLGLGCLIACLCAFRAHRLWRQSTVLRTAVPLEIEEALQRLYGGGLPGPVLLRGRLEVGDPLVSPGGIVCAFYDADIRRRAWLGQGARVALERGRARSLYVRGQEERVRVELTAEALHAPVSERSVAIGVPFVWGLGPALAEGALVEDAVSHERVGKLNEPCAVIGVLELDSNGPVIRRSEGVEPVLIVGEPHEGLSDRIAWRGAVHALAAALTTCAAGALAAALGA